MKKVTGAIVLMMFIALGASAQQKQGDHHRGKAGQHREHFAKDLNLSDAQKQQIKSINDSYRKRMTELNKNESITVKEMRERKSSLAKEHQQAIEGVYTPEQKTKLQELKTKGKEKKQQTNAKGMEKMKKELGLNADQSAKLKTLNNTYRMDGRTAEK